MITSELVGAVTFACITFGMVLLLSFVFYWAGKIANYEENKELKRLREENKELELLRSENAHLAFILSSSVKRNKK